MLPSMYKKKQENALAVPWGFQEGFAEELESELGLSRQGQCVKTLRWECLGHVKRG